MTRARPSGRNTNLVSVVLLSLRHGCTALEKVVCPSRTPFPLYGKDIFFVVAKLMYMNLESLNGVWIIENIDPRQGAILRTFLHRQELTISSCSLNEKDLDNAFKSSNYLKPMAYISSASSFLLWIRARLHYRGGLMKIITIINHTLFYPLRLSSL